MLTKFWESISSNIVERWLDHIFGPAFLFWAGGLGLYVWKTGLQEVLQRIQVLNSFYQVGAIVLAVFLLVLSSVLIQAVHYPILRLLEGYWVWPLNYLGMGITALRKIIYTKNHNELRELMMASKGNAKLDGFQRERLATLDRWAHRHPVKVRDLLPTTLGNILRAREQSPERKYGLDAVVCWPRLWSLLPENVRTDLTAARASLDRLAELWFWGFLFLIWMLLVPWAGAFALIWMFIVYRMVCQYALSYGDLLEAAFDLHRFLLYDAMNWPRPKKTQEEQARGAELTEYLWRGTLAQHFAYPRKSK